MDSTDQPLVSEGFVRRIASSFSSKINCTDKNKPKRVPVLSTNKNVADIKKMIESNMLIHDEKEQFQVEETFNGIHIHLKQPHLISVSSRSNAVPVQGRTSIKIFPLKLGRTTIGSAVTNDIVLSGSGVQPQHCYIETGHTFFTTINASVAADSKKWSKSIKEINLVTLYPIGHLCAVDGVIIDQPFPINSGWQLCFNTIG